MESKEVAIMTNGMVKRMFFVQFCMFIRLLVSFYLPIQKVIFKPTLTMQMHESDKEIKLYISTIFDFVADSAMHRSAAARQHHRKQLPIHETIESKSTNSSKAHRHGSPSTPM